MATQAYIGTMKKSANGGYAVHTLQLGIDGYPEYAGDILTRYYNAKDVNNLLAVGDIRELFSSPAKTIKTQNRYYNDAKRHYFNSDIQFCQLFQTSTAEYAYLFNLDEQRWYYLSHHTSLQPL
ncbi:hypothetical protein EV694_1981 [Volucribacter psittacicida]|uniref:Uncharacterized protein n=1 Tax=Volucribacter psittacicida TaxID=203482 RepID=A0A4R1FMC6_9PAST|nr:hypothetical protein [Volucribacter psittacicida]TCJ95977.1 hypothetical protein EV694_1981 [Volucribacter psittacicida]